MRAALRRAGPTTKLFLHLEFYDIVRNYDSATAILDMIGSRGHQFIRELTLDGNWLPSTFNQELISSLFSRLEGEWKSLLHFTFDALPPHAHHFDTALSSFLNSMISAAPVLQYINIPAEILPWIERKLSKKHSLLHLDIARSPLFDETFRFSTWPNIKSLKIRGYGSHIENSTPLDLRAIDPAGSAHGDIFAFPLLTHGEFIGHTLEFHSNLRLGSLTDLVLSGVHVKAIASHSVEMPLLRRLVVENTRGINCIIAPILETLSIGQLCGPVDLAYYLSNLFSGDPHQLDPVHLDLRPIYREDDLNIVDMTVPLASVYLLRRLERISIARLAVVRGADRWKYRMLQSVNTDDGKAMVMLPKWKVMDLGQNNVPDWLWDIIIARQVAGFPVQLNLTEG